MRKFDKGLPVKALYSQLLDEIRGRILAGELAAGTRLPTEFEIAQQYKVSRGTVRQALSLLVNEGLLERIQGSGTFVRQPIVPAEGPGRAAIPKSIGVILSQSSDELSMGILLGVEQAVKPRGYQLSFAYAEEDAQEMAQDIVRLQASTAGLVIFPVSNMPRDASIVQLKDNNFPFVLVDRYVPGLDCDYVVSDNLGGGYRATEHLLILGHTHIGFAYSRAGGLLTTSVRDRWEGYRRALQEYNRPYEESFIYHNLPDAGEEPERFDQLVTGPERPDAIFVVNDGTALNIFQAAQRNGIRVPEDLALVGFDDASYAAHMSIPLTTVTQQRTEMGLRAGTLLINRIESQVSGAPKHIELPTSLIIRQSCGARQRVFSTNVSEGV